MKKILIISLLVTLIACSCCFAAEEGKLFSDLGEYHWAYDSIKEMVENKIINGYPDGTFRPENSITRAEAAKILMLSHRESAVFPISIDAAPDVPAEHWAARYVLNGDLFIKPYADGSFKPDQKITRLEFSNALGIALERVKHNNVETVTFTDVADLDETSLKNISLLVNLGIINGYEDNTFKPNGTLTRAELAKMVSSSLKYRTTKYIAEVENTTGWEMYDKETGWHSEVQHDDEGNLKVMSEMNGIPTQLYYNGKFVIEAEFPLDTVKLENIVTEDGQSYNIKWYGSHVVELTKNDNGTFILTDHSTGHSQIIENELIPLEQAEMIFKDYFADVTYYSFFESEGHLCFGIPGSYIGTDFEENEQGQRFVTIYKLEDIIWMFEVNENTAEQKAFIKEELLK